MLELGWSLAAFVVAIGVLVTVHEFGHFWVARRLGFKVLRFSVGFGRPLLAWRGGAPDHTEYWLAAVPLGGYVKMLDEREAPVAAADSARAFNRRPVAHRIAVLLAGPGFNFVFAIAAFWLMFVVGVPGLKPIVAAVAPDSIAARAGLRADDEITAVGDRATATWEDAAVQFLGAVLDERLTLTVRGADGSTRHLELDVAGKRAELTMPGALFSALGMRPGPPPAAALGEFTADSPAERAGLEVGDRVLRVDGTAIRDWNHLVEVVRARPGESADFVVRRGTSELVVPVEIGADRSDAGETIGRIGAGAARELSPELAPEFAAERRYGVLEAVPRAVAETWEMSALTLAVLGRMVVGQVSPKNVSGPIGIAEMAGVSARAGLSYYLSFLAVVSLSLGVLNLLPVPILDGGQIVYQVAEAVKGAPLSERALVLGQQVGLFLLIALMSFAIYNDLSRWLG